MSAEGGVVLEADRPGDVRDPDFSPEARDGLLRDDAPGIAQTRGDPIVVLRAGPTRVVFANASAAGWLDGQTPEALTAALTQAGARTWQRLQHLAEHLPPRPTAQMERLRLPVAGQLRQVTLLCRAFVDSDQKAGLLAVASGLGRELPRAPVPRIDSAPVIDNAPEIPAPEARADAGLAQFEPGIATPPNTVASSGEVAMPDASRRFVWRAGADSKITHVSDAGLAALGLAPEACLGKSWDEIIAHPPETTRLAALLAQPSSWGGEGFDWGDARRLTLGATPIFKPVRLFAGWRGYGVVEQTGATLAEGSTVPLNDGGHADKHRADVIQEGESLADAPASIVPHDATPQGVLTPADILPAAPLVAETVAQDEAAAPAMHGAANDVADPATVEPALQAHEVVEVSHEVAEGSHEMVDGSHEAHELAHETPPATRVLPLTAAESRAFNEIGARLTPTRDAIAPVSAASLQEASTDEEPDRNGLQPETRQTDPHAGLLDLLPLGILIARSGQTLFINTPLLHQAGFADVSAFEAAGGADHLTRRLAPVPRSNEAGEDAEPHQADGGFHLRQIDWQGQPASLITAALPPADPEEARRHRADACDAAEQVRDLRAILDTATDGVVTLDASGHMLSLNKSAEALFGCDGADCVGQPFASLLQRDAQAAFASYFEGVGSNGVASVMNDGRETIGRTAKGGQIPLFMTLGRIGTPDAPRFCAVLRDMTQWKKVEAELNAARREAERASAVKSEFLARISHEIRTPLSAILGFSEVMSEERLGPVGNERYREYLKDIHASGQHVMSLVNDLLDLSKIESGKLEMNFTSVDINHIADECIMLMQPVAAREHVVLRRSLAANLPPVVADERSLRQIMLNILSNAIKFNVSSGQVIVSTALTDSGHAVLRVRDTGTGMSEDDVQLAMEPFRQLPNATQKRGTGLGLPITRALIEANRASLVIRSRPNEGTMVEVAFPPTRVLAE